MEMREESKSRKLEIGWFRWMEIGKCSFWHKCLPCILFYSLPQIWENSPYVMGNSCSILQRPHNFFFFLIFTSPARKKKGRKRKKQNKLPGSAHYPGCFYAAGVLTTSATSRLGRLCKSQVLVGPVTIWPAYTLILLPRSLLWLVIEWKFMEREGKIRQRKRMSKFWLSCQNFDFLLKIVAYVSLGAYQHRLKYCNQTRC